MYAGSFECVEQAVIADGSNSHSLHVHTQLGVASHPQYALILMVYAARPYCYDKRPAIVISDSFHVQCGVKAVLSSGRDSLLSARMYSHLCNPEGLDTTPRINSQADNMI
jgi:hypothetical protein